MKKIKSNDSLNKKDAKYLDVMSFLKKCQKDKRLKGEIEKVYEILICAVFETLLDYSAIQAMSCLDRKTNKLLEDFGFVENLLLSLNSEYSHLGAVGHILHRKKISLKPSINLDFCLRVRHVALRKDVLSTNTNNDTERKFIVVCSDQEKLTITNLIVQLGNFSSKEIIGVVSEGDLKEWYDKCLSPEYMPVLGSPLIKKLNDKIRNGFPSINIVPYLT